VVGISLRRREKYRDKSGRVGKGSEDKILCKMTQSIWETEIKGLELRRA
jgi:hypothetical protein